MQSRVSGGQERRAVSFQNGRGLRRRQRWSTRPCNRVGGRAGWHRGRKIR
uniref:Uncharacterized protein n=1 Tax=Hyaloperonospora arabidopsidis (strain Emoy2) TaxID=559515 RepID=M4BDM1_HYAAE